MREILYKYNTLGLYQTEDDTAFGGEEQLKIVVEPHDFSLAIGDEVLRNTAYDGGAVVVSRDGGVVFYDAAGAVIAEAEKGDTCYEQVHLGWKPDCLTVEFGQVQTVDYYPNCDGEHDRWGEEWVAHHTVALDLKDGSVKAE